MEIFYNNYKPHPFSIKKCDLVFEIYEEHTRVTSLLELTRDDKSVSDLELDALDLELEQIFVDDEEFTNYEVAGEKLILKGVRDSFQLIIINRVYPDKNFELEGLYRSGSIICTQNEPEGFRRITPFIDRSDNMCIFKTTIVADKTQYPVLLGNGNYEASFDLNDGRRGTIWSDPHPKPSYLFAIVAGDLGVIKDRFITKSNKRVDLCIYTDKGSEQRAHHAMVSLKNSMKWDEEVYGREYDLSIYNIVAVDSFNMGAMENKSLNIFNSAYVLADPASATDADFLAIESVIAHEYFHNWSGNRVTCRNWFELTLKEGLTVFRDQCFSSYLNSAELERIKMVKTLKERQFSEDASPTAHPLKPSSYKSINNFYTATVYEKGAEVIRMIYSLLGKKLFYKSMDLYFSRYDGKAIGTEEFVSTFEEVSRVDLSQFRRWYTQYKTPTLQASEMFAKNRYTIALKQVIPPTHDGIEQKPYHYPLSVAMFSKDGSLLHSEVLEVKNEYEEFSFPLSQKPILSLNRGFSAPIIVNFDGYNEAFLMRHESDNLARYEAAMAFGTKTVLDPSHKEEFLASFGYILGADLEADLKAYMLDLPSITQISSGLEDVDFVALCEAREELFASIASTYRDDLLSIYHTNHEPDVSDLSGSAKRSLKNQALKLLSFGDGDDICDLAIRQYKKSSTLNDRIFALVALEQLNTPQKEEIFAHFYETNSQNTLVVQKYFSIIASSSHSGTLARVKELQNDPAYDEKVPNLLRSVVGSFARNHKHFHSYDGSGYQFLADEILKIDIFNAQMSASLAQNFRIYPRLESQNKNLLYSAIKGVFEHRDLSENLKEILEKIITS